MLKKSTEGIYRSTLLESIPGLTHGYSSRHLGDMRNKPERTKFISRLKLSGDLILVQQVHGNYIKEVASRDSETIIAKADGLVVNKTSRTPILGIRTADCLPILAVDPQRKIIGAAHAGWRGTLANIAGNLVKAMVKLGAEPSDIFISLGPHIGACCYNIDEKRADKFSLEFLAAKDIVFRNSGQWYLDLGAANCKQFIRAGVLSGHIDRDGICTFSRNDEFYSYRKDTKDSFGEMMGIIGFTG